MHDDHFSKVAGRYRELRTTDPEPVRFIRDSLPPSPGLGVDVGCGTGRYTERLHAELPWGTWILAADRNGEMLRVLKGRAAAGRVQPVRASAEELPLLPRSVDWMTTFNAVHHLDLRRFLGKAAEILKAGGMLFIYTRTREQNAGSVWGRFFPGFTEKEKRLLSEPELRDAVEATEGLRLLSFQTFRYPRRSTPERLREQAENAHYSTFCLYGREEFSEALGKFLGRLPRGPVVGWSDENLMVVCECRP